MALPPESQARERRHEERDSNSGMDATAGWTRAVLRPAEGAACHEVSEDEGPWPAGASWAVSSVAEAGVVTA